MVLAPPKTAATAADGGGGRFGSSELPARMAAAKALAAGAKAKYVGGFGAASEAEKRELVAALREKRERLEQEVMEDGAAERAAEAKRRADVAAKAAEARAARVSGWVGWWVGRLVGQSVGEVSVIYCSCCCCCCCFGITTARSLQTP